MKLWGLKDITGFFGTDPFEFDSKEEAELQAQLDNPAFYVLVRRVEGGPWVPFNLV